MLCLAEERQRTIGGIISPPHAGSKRFSTKIHTRFMAGECRRGESVFLIGLEMIETGPNLLPLVGRRRLTYKMWYIC